MDDVCERRFQMKVFVSYTRRDVVVNLALLTRLHAHLAAVCTPFIHAIEEPRLKNQQFSVLRALFASLLVILIVSPAILKSPWVRLELWIARLLLCPVVRLDAALIAALRIAP
jgi:hypothetical protein